MTIKVTGRIIALILMAALVFWGCGDDDDSITGDDTGYTESDLDSAIVEMGDLMSIMIDSVFDAGESVPADFDYAGLHQFFKDYLSRHPGDPTASFAAAITSVLMFATGDELDSMVNEVIDYADSAWGPFKLIVPNPAKLSGTAEMLRFPTEISGAGVESNFLAQTYFAVLSKTLADPMDISDVQEFLKTDFMPALDDAIEYMDNVIGDAGYVFWVTPEMMGETSSDSIEVDRADFLIFAAGLRTIKSFCHMMVAYDIDVPVYDSTAFEYIVNQSNGWMSLHEDGTTQMAAAKTEFLDAVDLVEDALAALENEKSTDPNQSNDLIKADWSAAEFDEANAILDSIDVYMAAPRWIHGHFDDDWNEDSVRVDAAAIFDNPIDGILSLLPPYTAEITTGVDTSWYYEWYWNGYEYVYIEIPYEYEIMVVIFTWEADTFNDWVFPNPTINGILPDITTDAAFKELFGLISEDWTKEMELQIDFDIDLD